MQTQAGEPRWITRYITGTERCEDCDLRDALDSVGQPRRHKDYGFNLAYGCAGCRGTGRAGQKVSVDVSGVLDCLTEKQRYVIERRYGFDGKEHTLVEIAYLMGTTKQAVHKHEQLAKRKLFPPMVDFL
jgi:DNA-directed RNA polymerase specialized sigma24 family protein